MTAASRKKHSRSEMLKTIPILGFAPPGNHCNFAMQWALFHWWLQLCWHGNWHLNNLPPLPQSSLSPDRRGWVKTSHLGLCTVRLWASVLVPVYCKEKKLLWGWLHKKLIYDGYSRVISGVILLLYSFNRTIIFGFPLGPWPIWSHVLAHPKQCQEWVPSRGMGINSNQIVVDCSLNVYAIVAPAYHNASHHCRSLGLLLGWHCLSHMIACRAPSTMMNSIQ